MVVPLLLIKAVGCPKTNKGSVSSVRDVGTCWRVAGIACMDTWHRRRHVSRVRAWLMPLPDLQGWSSIQQPLRPGSCHPAS